LDRGTDLEYDRFKEEKKRGRTLTKMFKINTMAKKVDAISKLTKQRDDIEERKEKKIKTTIGYMPGDTQRDQYSAFRKRRKDHKIRKINRDRTVLLPTLMRSKSSMKERRMYWSASK
jgi:hypothetical protein